MQTKPTLPRIAADRAHLCAVCGSPLVADFVRGSDDQRWRVIYWPCRRCEGKQNA